MKTPAVAALLTAAVVLALQLGCDDNDLGIDKRRPNQPPRTRMSSSPPDSTSGTNYRVRLFWSGNDPDGTVDHYDFILMDHPAADDSIATHDPDAANRVVVRVPEVDDPRWMSTSAGDTLIVTRADTLRHPPPTNPTENEFVRRQSFERWHTFFVRAVDNEGLVDPTPEYRSFNSQTLAPNVFLKRPVDPTLAQFSAPRVVVFNWDGSDEVGDGTIIEPIASRWTLLQTRATGLGEYVGYPDTLYKLAPSAWTPWRRWDASDQSGVQAIVKGLISAAEGGGRYLFAVQVMDEAGAVTPVFDATSNNKNNVARIFVVGDVGAKLIVNEKYLGQFLFTTTSPPVVLAVAAGQPISFRWRGDASSYGGSVIAYRYGWNIRDPTNDEEWDQNWCSTCRSAPARTFNSGTQRFVLEARDNAETVTHAEFELVVARVTRSRDVLFVDDSSYPPGALEEVREDERWSAVFDSLQARQPFTFDPTRDSYDVEKNRFLPPDLSIVFDYQTIVWSSRTYNVQNGLRTLAFFYDPFVPSSAVPKFNYLNLYIENGGEFWLSGDGLADALWPVTRQSNPQHQFPVNVTDWDDPVLPHPGVDSVGVASFLWKMGVEAVDLGAGNRAPAPRGETIAQGCVGFRRATPQGYEFQRFESSVDVDHQHGVQIPSLDVDRPPAAGATYTTEMQAGHVHTVTLSAAQLQALRRGNRLQVTSSSSEVPIPHTHIFDLVDRVGLWGAPLQLDKGDDQSWPLPPPSVNRNRGRFNVEIYNMSSFLSQQEPPLSPPGGLWLGLYNYISLTPENPNANPPLIYPATAGGQASVILRKRNLTDATYSRAVCGFAPWRLRLQSHVELADEILLRHFRLGVAGAP